MYTEAQTREAILQNPHIAIEMALSEKELEICKSYSKVSTSELEQKYSSKSNASRFMNKLLRKGYFKRVGVGLYERVFN